MSAPVIPRFSVVPTSSSGGVSIKSATLDSNASSLSTSVTDSAILDHIFDPNVQPLPIRLDNDEDTDAFFADDVIDSDAILLPPLSAADAAEVAELIREGIVAAERHEYAAAIDTFTRALRLAPTDCRLYTNRAQAHALSRDFTRALTDLNDAIRFGRAARERQTLQQAYTHRGALYKYLQRNDDALADFTIASRLGSKLAKAELAAANPYAKLCHQAVQQMINATMGIPDDDGQVQHECKEEQRQ